MQITRFGNDGGRFQEFRNFRDFTRALWDIGEEFLSHVHQQKKLSIDMDGVLIQDDNAITAARLVAGPVAQRAFSQCSDLNIRAAAEGAATYCWYAPSILMAHLLNGLPVEVNRVVGSHMRLIPGAEQLVHHLSETFGYEITAITAGHQEAAEEVSRRIGIERTIGTQFGVVDGKYDGSIKRFIGGQFKLKQVDGVLRNGSPSYMGTHVGDSWSDVHTLEAVPGSIAFNPGCEPALRGAQISVIGTSLRGLFPLLTPGYSISDEEDLPENVIVMTERPYRGNLNGILEKVRHVKKNVLEERVFRAQGSFDQVEINIKAALDAAGIPYATLTGIPTIDGTFDHKAREAYQSLCALCS